MTLPDPLADPFERDRVQRASPRTHVPRHAPDVEKALARMSEDFCPDFEHGRLDDERWCDECRVSWGGSSQQWVVAAAHVERIRTVHDQASKVRPGGLTQQQVRYMAKRVQTDLRSGSY